MMNHENAVAVAAQVDLMLALGKLAPAPRRIP